MNDLELLGYGCLFALICVGIIYNFNKLDK
jgi:hypothetical protein